MTNCEWKKLVDTNWNIECLSKMIPRSQVSAIPIFSGITSHAPEHRRGYMTQSGLPLRQSQYLTSLATMIIQDVCTLSKTGQTKSSSGMFSTDNRSDLFLFDQKELRMSPDVPQLCTLLNQETYVLSEKVKPTQSDRVLMVQNLVLSHSKETTSLPLVTGINKYLCPFFFFN